MKRVWGRRSIWRCHLRVSKRVVLITSKRMMNSVLGSMVCFDSNIVLMYHVWPVDCYYPIVCVYWTMFTVEFIIFYLQPLLTYWSIIPVNITCFIPPFVLIAVFVFLFLSHFFPIYSVNSLEKENDAENIAISIIEHVSSQDKRNSLEQFSLISFVSCE